MNLMAYLRWHQNGLLLFWKLASFLLSWGSVATTWWL